MSTKRTMPSAFGVSWVIVCRYFRDLGRGRAREVVRAKREKASILTGAQDGNVRDGENGLRVLS